MNDDLQIEVKDGVTAQDEADDVRASDERWLAGEHPLMLEIVMIGLRRQARNVPSFRSRSGRGALSVRAWLTIDDFTDTPKTSVKQLRAMRRAGRPPFCIAHDEDLASSTSTSDPRADPPEPATHGPSHVNSDGF